MSGSRSKTIRATRSPVGKARRAQRSRTPLVVAAIVVLVVLGLFAIYNSRTTGDAVANDRYDVGSPAIGATAPDFLLPDVTAPAAPGGLPATVELSNYRGKTVLLYFHEGLGCQPCWNQIRDLQRAAPQLAGVGVDQLLSITGGPPELIGQKMRDDGLSAPALADTDLAVSTRYQANQFGMMGTSSDGHSFVLVGPDGRIQWRADYGGAPNYTMYVPVDQLLADLTAGRRSS